MTKETFEEMALFNFSDIVIAVTLLLNGIALMSTNITRKLTTLAASSDSGAVEDEEGQSLVDSKDHDIEENAIKNSQNINFYLRLQRLVMSVRRYSFLISVWNFVFFVLMFFVFDD